MSTSIFFDTYIEALFVSDLQPSQHPSGDAVRAAISRSLKAHGSQNCAALVAQEYGEHPETATARMTWARTTLAWTTDRLPAAA